MEENTKKLFVGNLSFNTTEDGLKEMFAQAGTVESAIIIYHKDSQRSKGFGFVEMSSEDEAKAAVEKLNGQELDGRAVTVNLARPKTEGPRRDFGSSNRY